MTIVSATSLTPGTAEGTLALLTAPLSLWGGFDVEAGLISDVTHPQHGRSLTAHILAMSAARGSSSSSSALVEAIRRGTAPAAILLCRVDPILVIGSLVAADLYGIEVPILLVSETDWPKLTDGAAVSLRADVATAEVRLVETDGTRTPL